MFTVLATGNWSIDQIHARQGGAPRRIVPEVEAIINAAWAKLSQRPGIKLFDGRMMRLASFNATPDRLELVLSETSYKAFAGTHMARPDLAGRYGRDVVADPLGLSTIVVTSDDYLVMGWRKKSLAFYGGRVHPFAGAMEPNDDGPIQAAYRELLEELSLDHTAAGEIRAIGMVEEHRLQMRELICISRSPKTRKELVATLDDEEHHAACSVRGTIDEIDRAFTTEKVLTPVGRAAILLLGRLRFGQAWFESRQHAAGAECLPCGGLRPTLGSMSLPSDLQFVIDVARQAGALILDQWGKVDRLTKTHAATTDEAVTEADRASQRLIVAELRERFPKDGIIGEENDTGSAITAEIPDVMGRTWLIDPIDGTNKFICGLGAFAVCIGLLEKGSPTMGVVYDVSRNQMYAAAKGHGAWMNDKPIRAVSTPLSDSSMLMVTSNLLDKAGQCPEWAVRWIGQTDWKVRMLGSAALEAIQVAAGVAHGSVTGNGKLWDVVAPAAVVLEAGGTINTLTGGPVFPYDLKNYVGAKVPFLAAAMSSRDQLLSELSKG
ncbi:hypothetical protein BH10PLA1_BH10PLA1_04340 [soil metagenome]